MHITLHKIDHQEKAYWIAHTRHIRPNVVAVVLVRLEDGEASDKARDLKGLRSIGFALRSRTTLDFLIDRCPVVTKKRTTSQWQSAEKHLIKS